MSTFLRDRLGVMAVVLAASFALAACAGLGSRRDSATVLQDTIELYNRSLQAKKWRDAQVFWVKDKRPKFMEWIRSLPQGVRFASLIITHMDDTTPQDVEDPVPTQVVYLSVERYSESSISIKNEEWTQTWEYHKDVKSWELVSQSAEELP